MAAAAIELLKQYVKLDYIHTPLYPRSSCLLRAAFESH